MQIILVDDGSTDISAQVCAEMRARYPSCVEFLQLARNFGEHNAVMAGIKHATGDFCVVMDDDLQNPPSEVKVLLRQAALGFDLVYSRYRKRRHPLYRILGSKLQNWTACLALGKPPDLYLSSFKVFSSNVMKEVCRYNGPEPYLDAILLRATANISTVECQHSERGGGRSGYTWRKLIGLWCRLFVGFSVWPVRLVAVVGLVVCAIEAYRQPGAQSEGAAWATRATSLLLLALVGEYLGRIHLLLHASPQFVIKHKGLRSAVDINGVRREMDAAQRHEAL
ncbi:MAG: glycosyltransferase [Verrucomicrobia bacterium]|nr:glycosyltransferase [Verrucomicrobiota bacterium]